MQVRLKYNKNTKKITLEDSEDHAEFSVSLLEDTDKQICFNVFCEINPDFLEEPILFKVQEPE